MNEEKRKVLSSILNGRKKVGYYFKKYIVLKEKDEKDFDINLSIDLKEHLRNFIINLCNYANAIIDKKDFFDDITQLETLLNEKITPVTWKDCNYYTLKKLIKDFRNTNEHFDKHDSYLTYSLLESSVSIEKLTELYRVCDSIVDSELKRVKLDDIPGILLDNSETISSFHNALLKLSASNEREKTSNAAMYELNESIIDNLKRVDFATLDVDKLDEICSLLNNYLTNPNYKDEFVNEYGLDCYEEILTFNNDESSLEEYFERFNKIFNEIMEIEKNKKSN